MDQAADEYEQGNEESEDDEEVIRQIIAREKEILDTVSSEKVFEKLNLNKLNDREVIAVKKYMDKDFEKKKLKPGDEGFAYEVEKEFNPEESNEWDKSQRSVIQNGKEKVKNTPSGFNKQSEKSLEKTPKEKLIAMNRLNGDEEFDIDFDDDFNDDLDDDFD